MRVVTFVTPYNCLRILSTKKSALQYGFREHGLMHSSKSTAVCSEQNFTCIIFLRLFQLNSRFLLITIFMNIITRLIASHNKCKPVKYIQFRKEVPDASNIVPTSSRAGSAAPIPSRIEFHAWPSMKITIQWNFTKSHPIPWFVVTVTNFDNIVSVGYQSFVTCYHYERPISWYMFSLLVKLSQNYFRIL